MPNDLSIADSLHYIHEFDLNVNNREIYLISVPEYITGVGAEESQQAGVEFVQANRFIKNLNFLAKRSEDPIKIHLSTCGGYWQFGMQIFDAIRSCKNHITIINYSEARSMSSLIFLAADERIMHTHATFMFHLGTMAIDGTVKQYKTEGIQLDIATEQMLNIYIEAMKQKGCMKDKTEKQIKKWLISEMDKREECYLSAEQAVEYGFADSIIRTY